MLVGTVRVLDLLDDAAAVLSADSVLPAVAATLAAAAGFSQLFSP